jgi:hypothetical protein
MWMGEEIAMSSRSDVPSLGFELGRWAEEGGRDEQ